MGEDCKACGGAGTVMVDTLSGMICCCDCGVVIDDDTLVAEHQVGLVISRGGTMVSGDGGAIAAASSGRHFHNSMSSSQYWKSKKKFEAHKKIKDLSSLLRLQANDVIDVEAMVGQATAGEWGTGRWVGVLTGACIYIVVRRNHRPVTLAEIAYAADCDMHELGRMLNKVVRLLEVELPREDPIVFFERFISMHRCFTGFERNAVKRILEQCRVLMEWVERWYIGTGRRGMPVIGAVLKLVAEANGISLGIEEISYELHAHVGTCKKRHREILEAFVSTLKGRFNWFKQVSVDNVSMHLEFVLKYLELEKKRMDVHSGDPREKRRKVGDGLVASLRNTVDDTTQMADGNVVLPKAYVVSESERLRRVSKADLAAKRIEEAKRGLLGEKGDLLGGDSRGLDWEDMTIEYLLLRGVSREQIEQGYYESLVAELDEDETISDEDIERYIYTKDDIVELIQRVKMQNMMTSPWAS